MKRVSTITTALFAVLGLMSATLMLRSADAYHASALGVWKLQARAGAEGAAVLLRHAPAAQRADETIGSCRIRYRLPVAEDDDIVAPFTVSVLGRDRGGVHFEEYRATYRPKKGGGYQLVRLEASR